MKLNLALLLLMFLLSACNHFIVGTDPQLKPTQSFESEPATFKKKSELPVITAETVVVDARPPFEFAVSHIPGAVNIFWEDFNMPKGPQHGYLDDDLGALARRLAVAGIDPNTQVVVVGNIRRGQGEAGRVAWMLKYLGVREVAVEDVNLFSTKRGLMPDKPRENKAAWNISPREDWQVAKTEFEKGMYLPKVKRDSPVIIDARSEKEYLGRQQAQRPDVGAINIPFQQFFADNGQPNFDIVAKLNSVGITPDRKIWVISEKGVRSAAVVFALREMGFEKAANFSGGYSELFSQ